MGVRIQPGQTAFARTPRGPKSTAIDCMSMFRPALEVQYADESGPARRPASDDTATTEPPRCSRWGRAARAVRKAPVRLVRSTASQLSGVWSTTLPECDMPAQ